MNRSPRHNFSGFTLLELLVVMALLSLLILGLTGALQIGMKGLGTAVLSQNDDQVLMTQMFLRREIENIVPLETKSKIKFNGTGRRMNFVSIMPERAGAYGIHEMSLYFEQGQLVLAWRPEQTSQAFSRKILIDNIYDGEIAYFGAQPSLPEAGWSEQWNDPDGLPQLVRIRMVSSHGQWVWPDLIIAFYAGPDLGRNGG